ncbi:MAG TPA: DNA-protecting protein DprA [Devosia sp.]|nr:DNA-protecting protein DprA [Devosia sp.]
MYGAGDNHTQLSFAQRRAWLRLIRSGNVGPATFRQLINRFGDAESALEALPDLSLRGGAKSSPRIISPEQAEAEMEHLETLGARLVAIGEEDYPKLLVHIHAPPPLLATMGALPPDEGKNIAIVGARNASASGRKLAARIAAELGSEGYIIVSGLARGIDTAAHQASLETGTIAVFAGGLDHIYPRENIELARAIVENGGMLISEMPLGAEPRARDFPRRNRLVSGLARGVLVIEAAPRSGSLITARLALEQDREVFAVPGSPMDPRAGGTNRLIREGAILVTSAKDIVEELAAAEPRHANLFAPDHTLPYLKEAGGDVDETEISDADRQKVIEALSVVPTPVDDVIARTGLPTAFVQNVLLELDLAGRIERSAGQLVALV